jgi:hypothetical protein
LSCQKSSISEQHQYCEGKIGYGIELFWGVGPFGAENYLQEHCAEGGANLKKTENLTEHRKLLKAIMHTIY